MVPISLDPAKPHTFRVVDADGKPARLVPLIVSGYRTSTSGWVPTSAFASARLHTDARGEAVAPWLPRDLIQVEVDIFDDRWTIDEVDPAQIDKGITRVTVRRLHAVEGRVTMPGDASPEGLLVAGLGSSDNSSLAIHRVSARVRRDGTFTLYLASGYGYWLGVSDAQWASDPWMGLIGEPIKQATRPIQLAAYAAIPLTVRVTRGPNHEPVAGAYLDVAGGEDSMLWQQARRQTQVGSNGALAHLYTDRDGYGRIGVCKGRHTLSLEAGDWKETLTMDIGSDKPPAVEFHRPWADRRAISGRLIFQGRPHPSGPSTRVRAWNVSDPEVAADGVVEPDGRFTAKIDAPDVYLLAFDSQSHLSAAGRVSVKDSTATLDLIPTGSLSGVVVDSAGKPLAGHAVEALPAQGPVGVDVVVDVDQNGKPLPVNMGRMTVDGTDFQMGSVVLQSASCDAQGRFKIDLVPACLCAWSQESRPKRPRQAILPVARSLPGRRHAGRLSRARRSTQECATRGAGRSLVDSVCGTGDAARVLGGFQTREGRSRAGRTSAVGHPHRGTCKKLRHRCQRQVLRGRRGTGSSPLRGALFQPG